MHIKPHINNHFVDKMLLPTGCNAFKPPSLLRKLWTPLVDTIKNILLYILDNIHDNKGCMFCIHHSASTLVQIVMPDSFVNLIKSIPTI
jgi:hypothetical protein